MLKHVDKITVINFFVAHIGDMMEAMTRQLGKVCILIDALCDNLFVGIFTCLTYGFSCFLVVCFSVCVAGCLHVCQFMCLIVSLSVYLFVVRLLVSLQSFSQFN